MENSISDNILVSVVCTAYNHAPYIRQCLEGFVTQQTNFKFEVIVHDDASTDGTVEIIREYAEKYPDIIKPIFQTENQYSQKVNFFRTYIIPAISGKYTAFCEGDDYWCDPEKLQLCINAFNIASDIVMVTHNTKQVTVNDEFIKNELDETEESGFFDPHRMVRGLKCPRFSSFVIKTEEAIVKMPEFFLLVTGDNARRLHAITQGKVYYIGRVMSAYRVMVPGSWTVRQAGDIERQSIIAERAIAFYNAYNEFTNYEYAKEIEEAIKGRKLNLYSAQRNYKAAYELCKETGTPFKKIMRYYLLWKFPFIKKIQNRGKKHV